MAENKKSIYINPVTRIEGHAKITLVLSDSGEVSDARFHVDEFRGFEKFCEGRYFTEMPVITPRICGICPVSHTMASSKACEAIMRVSIPETAVNLRKIIHLGQIISSHALSFFHLSAPDFLLGFDSDPVSRNILGLAAKYPDVAKRGIRLRKFGQEVSERLTGEKIHTAGILAGGMAQPLSQENGKYLLGWIPEALETAQLGLQLFKQFMDSHKEDMEHFAPEPSLYFGLTGPEGEWEMYDGGVRIMDPNGKLLGDHLKPADYLQYVAEEPVSFSYLKYPYYRPMGNPAGFYRVGPLARLNIVNRMTTAIAQKEFEIYRSRNGGKPVHGALYYHYARLIENIAAIESIETLLRDPVSYTTDIAAQAGRNASEGVGCAEAPRGTLFHHYQVNEDGALTKVNLVIATGQNNPFMNRNVLAVAKRYVKGTNVTEGALNRVEATIRCYDPCLSCSTHAIGSMPLQVDLVNGAGELLKRYERG